MYSYHTPDQYMPFSSTSDIRDEQLNPSTLHQLHEQGEHYRYALEAAGVGTWDWNMLRQTIHWDGLCQELFGFPNESTVTYTEVIRHIHPDDHVLLRQAIRAAIQSPHNRTCDVQFRTIIDGKQRWLDGKGKAYFDEENRLYRFAGIVRDVTEEVYTRHILQDNASIFTSITQAVPVALWMSDQQGYTTYTSKKWADWTGRDLDSHLGLGWLDAIVMEDREQAARVFQGDFQARRPHRSEFRIKHLDGSIRWVDCSGNPHYDSNGIFKGYVGAVLDITDRVITQQKLEISQDHFYNLIWQAPFAIGLYVTEDIRIEMANDALLRMWSKDSSVIGKKLGDALPELKGQPFEAILKEVYRTGIPYETQEERAELYDGDRLRPYWFKFTYKPLKNERGEVWSILHMAVDITERVLARQKIADAEANLRLAIDTAELGTWHLDLRDRTLSLSDRISDWLGMEPVSNLESILLRIHRKDLEHVGTSLNRAIEAGYSEPCNEEFTIVHRTTGQQRIVHAQARTLMDEDGVAYALTGTAQDITNQKLVKQELERLVQQRTEALRLSNLELEHSNENLRQFAFVASHDLQEPLRKIQSFITLLYNSDAKQLSSKGVSTLDRIHASASRMSTLISDLLVFSSLTQKEIPMAEVSLSKLVGEVLEDLEESIRQANVQLDVGPLPIVWGNASQLKQLLQNFLTNALKFGASDRINHIRISGSEAAEEAIETFNGFVRRYHWIEISDSGIGFEPTYQDRIFQMFQRLHSKEKYEGTGIGLAVCRKVAENHQGSITVSSIPDQGTTFRVNLPATPPLPMS
ncbi:hypothetical protein BWI93_08805 [Siphonobacter sp. BAB-5385]|nr:hypothetical protein BWI93_08805 [Siphonobacter sp. BAB-5385]